MEIPGEEGNCRFLGIRKPSEAVAGNMIEGIEAIVLLSVVLVLLFFGPTKLPELARGIGRARAELSLARKESKLVLVDATRGSKEGIRDVEALGK